MQVFHGGERVRLNDAGPQAPEAGRVGTVLGLSEVYASVLWDDGERERICTRRLTAAPEAARPEPRGALSGRLHST